MISIVFLIGVIATVGFHAPGVVCAIVGMALGASAVVESEGFRLARDIINDARKEVRR